MIQTDKLTGRALDAAVAERVMGLKALAHAEIPFYSRDIAAAWTVHQRMLDTQPGEYAFAIQCLAGLWDLWGRTLQVLKAMTPELICRAALAAAGGRADG